MDVQVIIFAQCLLQVQRLNLEDTVGLVLFKDKVKFHIVKKNYFLLLKISNQNVKNIKLNNLLLIQLKLSIKKLEITNTLKEKEKGNKQGKNKGEDEPNQEQDENQQGDPKDNQEGKEPKDDGESKGKLTPEEIKGLLEAIQRAEEKTAQKANSKKAKGKKKSGEKDW